MKPTSLYKRKGSNFVIVFRYFEGMQSQDDNLGSFLSLNISRKGCMKAVDWTLHMEQCSFIHNKYIFLIYFTEMKHVL